MNSVVETFCVEDVYNLESEIGKELENIIDVYGVEATNLMPKVLSALEHLEFCVVRNDRVDLEVSCLNSTIAQLQFEKVEKQECKSKLEKELEQIENIWREETNKLSELVSKLKEENFQLSNSLKEKENILSEKSSANIPEQELKVVQKLKEIVERQREQIDKKDREFNTKCNDVDAIQQQVQKLVLLNKDLQRKQKHQQQQMKAIIEEKAQLQVCLEECQTEIQQLRDQLGIAMKKNFKLAQAEGKVVSDLKGKMVIDLDDPFRPRFTIADMRKVIFEKNELKTKISELENELTLCKPSLASRSESQSDIVPPVEDLQVQGPINREPEEKLFLSTKTSGIHRLDVF
ncbi:RILP-like protein 1 isoform X2 [Tachypleus tridentatus]|uniref:RILP-like protein 1 isoform X2 n=1 Tax=Tachypleus tridentatus TaxID=6853 RepID=UPI003FD4286D